MPMDRSRFIYSLAGAMLGGEWTIAGLKAVLNRPSPDRPVRVPKLAERVALAFPTTPEFHRLAVFLSADAGLARALAKPPSPVVHGSSRLVRRRQPDEKPLWLTGVRLPHLPTESALAGWFGVDIQRLRWRADTTGRNRKHPSALRTYRYRWIPRREGPPRLLEIPTAQLKQVQRKILSEILDLIPVHFAVHGFCVGRSIVTNAAVHCGQAVVLRFDLADFFPSIIAARVFRIFRTIGYPADVARLLMGLCTTSLPADVWNARPGARDGGDFVARQRWVTRHLP